MIPLTARKLVSAKRHGSVDIAGIIRREILHQKPYMTGDRLPSGRDLAEQYGVARGTIREALNLLVRDGYVEIRPGSGAYVIWSYDKNNFKSIEYVTPLELIDARFAIEPHVCRLAVLRASQQTLKEIRMLLDIMESSVDDAHRFAQADTAFHERLVDLSGNPILIGVMAQIAKARNQDHWVLMRRLTLTEEVIRDYNGQHRAILDAIEARDAELAASLMKEHLGSTRKTLMEVAST